MRPLQPGDALDTYADSSRLAREINWRPATPIAEGVRRFAEWHTRPTTPPAARPEAALRRKSRPGAELPAFLHSGSLLFVRSSGNRKVDFGKTQKKRRTEAAPFMQTIVQFDMRRAFGTDAFAAAT